MVPKIIRQEDFLPFAEALFDWGEQARKAAPILKGILDAGFPRLSDISHTMPGSPAAGYKAIQRFLAEVDPRDVLLRLVDEEAPLLFGAYPKSLAAWKVIQAQANWSTAR